VERERIRACLALGGGLRGCAGGYGSRSGVAEGVFCVVRTYVDNKSPKRVVQVSGDGVETRDRQLNIRGGGYGC